ncbi:hypothetical protein, partial [Kitasatospora sp. NPDC057595]
AEAGVERPERRPLRVEPAVAELTDEELETAHELAQAVAEEQDQAAQLAEPDAAVSADGADVEPQQDQAERRPTWRDRVHGELTDEELQSAHTMAMNEAQQAAAAAEAAAVQAEAKQAEAAAGIGPAAQAVQAQADALQQRAAAVEALAELVPIYEDAGAATVELRARLAAAEAGMDARRRGPRERAAAEAAELRAQLEQANRRMVELDIQRDKLDRLAGPVGSRAGAAQQWQSTAQALPQMLAQARTSDQQDAALAAATARSLQQRAVQAQGRVGTLTDEQRIRAGLPAADSLTEQVQRTAARLSVATQARTSSEYDAAAYGYDQAQEWAAEEDRGRSL